MTEKDFKYFIGYKDDKKVRLLCIMPLKMSANRRDFHETKWMSFLIEDAELLEKYNEIWDKVSNNVKKWSDSEPVYNHKYLKSQKKILKRKVNTSFYGNKVPKQVSHCICLSVSLIDSAFRISKNCYSQVFSEQCKHIVKNIFFERTIFDKIFFERTIFDNVFLSSFFERAVFNFILREQF